MPGKGIATNGRSRQEMQDYGNGAEEAENRIAEEEYEIWENRDQYGIEW